MTCWALLYLWGLTTKIGISWDYHSRNWIYPLRYRLLLFANWIFFNKQHHQDKWDIFRSTQSLQITERCKGNLHHHPWSSPFQTSPNFTSLVVYLPLWKIWVSWGDYSQLNGKIKFMFQTTNQSQINRTVLELQRRWEAVALGKAHPKFVHWWLNTFHNAWWKTVKWVCLKWQTISKTETYHPSKLFGHTYQLQETQGSCLISW